MANKYSKLIKAIKDYCEVCDTFSNADYLWAGYISIDKHEDGITLYNTMSKDSDGFDAEICTFYYKGIADEVIDDFCSLDLVAVDFDGTDLLRRAFEEAGIEIC